MHKQVVWRWSSFGIWGSVLYIYNWCCCRETSTAVSCASRCIKSNTFILRWWCEINNGLTRIFSNCFLNFPSFKMMSQRVLDLRKKIKLRVTVYSIIYNFTISSRPNKSKRKYCNIFVKNAIHVIILNLQKGLRIVQEKCGSVSLSILNW